MDGQRAMTIDSQTHDAITEIETLIRAQYPSAVFTITKGEDPAGTYLIAAVDVDDPDKVVDIFIDRLLQMQIGQGLPLYVIPLRTAERNAKLADAQSLTKGSARGHAAISS